jgi:protein transport protein SEC61 subunit gamma-like protein
MVIEPLTKFVKDSTYLVKKCTKPDHKGKSDFMFACLLCPWLTPVFIPLVHHFTAEFAKVARATGLGFLLMGFIGFFVKLVHIPINNIIMGGM